MSTLEPPAPAKFDDCASNYDALHAESMTASGESTEYKPGCLQRLGLRRHGAVPDDGCGIGNLIVHHVPPPERVGARCHKG